MNSPKTGLRTAATVFGLMAAAQAGRLILRPQVLVNGWEMPLWPSLVALVVLAALAAWLWSLSRERS